MDFEITFDSKVYSIETLKKSAYRYINVFSIDFEVNGDKVLSKLHFNKKFTNSQCTHYIDEFKKEVLDQDLRETIKIETESVRNLILAKAFSKTSLIDDE
jgi:His-Xaa-Ser system protein HxsD